MDNLENKEINSAGNDKTLVVFSGNLDKAIASFIIADGAAAMGRKVTMLFTFWGLNILRKPTGGKIKKDFLGRMFGMMMPKGPQKLKLSQMSMGGLGGKMIRYIMKKNNIASLEELIEQGINQGIRIIACSMSMDLMGIKKEELIDGIEMGGVATYLAAAETADTNLFI
jgi:peroxiredoxin family protein